MIWFILFMLPVLFTREDCAYYCLNPSSLRGIALCTHIFHVYWLCWRGCYYWDGREWEMVTAMSHVRETWLIVVFVSSFFDALPRTLLLFPSTLIFAHHTKVFTAVPKKRRPKMCCCCCGCAKCAAAWVTVQPWRHLPQYSQYAPISLLLRHSLLIVCSHPWLRLPPCSEEEISPQSINSLLPHLSVVLVTTESARLFNRRRWEERDIPHPCLWHHHHDGYCLW